MSKSKIILLLSGYQLTWLMCVFGEVVYSTYMPGLICGLVFGCDPSLTPDSIIQQIVPKRRHRNLASFF